ncbi:MULTISPECIES: hypothetical protein, partial [Paenibacillus]
MTLFSGEAGGGNRERGIHPQPKDTFCDRTLDIHTCLLTAYPPMSRGVFALTFLRSASQEVDAVSCSFT